MKSAFTLPEQRGGKALKIASGEPPPPPAPSSSSSSPPPSPPSPCAGNGSSAECLQLHASHHPLHHAGVAYPLMMAGLIAIIILLFAAVGVLMFCYMQILFSFNTWPAAAPPAAAIAGGDAAAALRSAEAAQHPDAGGGGGGHHHGSIRSPKHGLDGSSAELEGLNGSKGKMDGKQLMQVIMAGRSTPSFLAFPTFNSHHSTLPSSDRDLELQSMR